jgi:hypothetical protein
LSRSAIGRNQTGQIDRISVETPANYPANWGTAAGGRVLFGGVLHRCRVDRDEVCPDEEEEEEDAE